MSWNQAEYDRGYALAKEMHEGQPLDALMAVDMGVGEAEVGWSDYIRDVLVRTDYIAAAQWILKTNATGTLVRLANYMVEQGKALWVVDPHVSGVVGLVKAESTNQALVIVYTKESDFEVAGEMDDLIAEHPMTTGATCIDCGTATFCGKSHGGDHDHSPEAKECSRKTLYGSESQS